ncbi:MAG: adenine phosphoribosyltransferase [Candidatus Omnitrophica bacterium]|nr:adenine phosphoribosyltransferase [Candidatus Omnitrophota bacterium]MCM8770107.1 adenine phosphoribosyltransferase [Candidatus Omnitrophota bacterium]
MSEIARFIREVPDFPKPGILFRDITPLLEDAGGFRTAVKELVSSCPKNVDKVVAIESRGFIFGAALAYALGKGFVPVRKSGKLPWEKIKVSYDLEYGTDTLEIHRDGLKNGEKVVLVDDLLATGGTAAACCQLIESCGASVSRLLFLIELKELKGRERLKQYQVVSLLRL